MGARRERLTFADGLGMFFVFAREEGEMMVLCHVDKIGVGAMLRCSRWLRWIICLMLREKDGGREEEKREGRFIKCGQGDSSPYCRR